MSEAKFDPKKFLQFKLRPKQELLHILKAKPAVMTPRPAKRRSLAREILKAVVIAMIIVAVIRIFFVQVVTVSSDSMEPSLSYKDAVVVNKIAYGIGNPFWRTSQTPKILSVVPNPLYKRLAQLSKARYLIRLARDPKRMEVVVIKSPVKGQEGRDLVKRIIALPGEKVGIKKGVVYVNGRKIGERPGTRIDRSNYPPVRLRYGTYFVLGDNRARSLDSRSFGPLSGDDILGEVYKRIWPANKGTSPIK